jgi:sterol desaturase/sphingolipid hydroxylase (fatty acid hydroxylase superfamily)
MDTAFDRQEPGLTAMNAESLSKLADLTIDTLKHSPYLFLLLVLSACLVRELRIPQRVFARRSLGRSYTSNIATFLFNDTVLSLLSLPSLFYVAQNFSGHGLLSRMPDGALKWLISFILLDLAMYLWHVANHQYDALWRFHKVHHSDITLNVTTGLRFHVGELILTVLVKACFIVLVGVEARLVMMNELVLTSFVVFHHMNSSLRGERVLGILFIVPRLHRLHHSVRREEHDHNYGGALTLWDRLFGTLREGEPETIGLKNVGELGFWGMIRFGLADPHGQPNDYVGEICPWPPEACPWPRTALRTALVNRSAR